MSPYGVTRPQWVNGDESALGLVMASGLSNILKNVVSPLGYLTIEFMLLSF